MGQRWCNSLLFRWYSRLIVSGRLVAKCMALEKLTRFRALFSSSQQSGHAWSAVLVRCGTAHLWQVNSSFQSCSFAQVLLIHWNPWVGRKQAFRPPTTEQHQPAQQPHANLAGKKNDIKKKKVIKKSNISGVIVRVREYSARRVTLAAF